MEWRDEALVLSARPFGESSKIVEVLGRREGRAAGMVRGARGKTTRALLQPGNRVAAIWRGRTGDQLGTLQLEMMEARAGRVMETAHGAFGLGAIATLLAFLPERDPQPRLYAAADALIEAFADALAAGEVGVRFELILLEEFGFGLDLSCCAATGSREDLAFVSPRTGRAVSRGAGAPFRDRLLPLPAFLTDAATADAEGVAAGFRLTGHFIGTHIAGAVNRRMPEPRARFVAAVVKAMAREEARAREGARARS
jgi:DNA repair protein RecO (recombination protein O)